jgi:hypothetical protein
LQLPAATSFFLFHSFPAFLPAAKMDNTPWVTRCSSTSFIGNLNRASHLETAGPSKHSHKHTCWQQEPPADWFSIFSLPRHRAWPVWELQTMTRLTQKRLTTCKSSLKVNCPGQHVPDGRQRFTREKIHLLSSCNGMNRTQKGTRKELKKRRGHRGEGRRTPWIEETKIPPSPFLSKPGLPQLQNSTETNTS